MEPLISVIMSTYNESIDELEKSIGSILKQTYQNIEFVIVCDNPGNEGLCNYLDHISDKRVKVVINEKNKGLVWSLNRALQYASGVYIARMDADDISMESRLTDQLHYIIKTKSDLIGSFIKFIDENENTIQEIFDAPIENEKIVKSMRWGSVLAHPTWFGKREVFDKLKGYRNIPYSEDYDFLIRAIHSGFVLGNLNKVELEYRIRNEGISKSNEIKQYVIHEYLAKDYISGKTTSEKALWNYIESSSFEKDVAIRSNYQKTKNIFKNKHSINKIIPLLKLMSFKFFWRGIYIKIFNKY